MTTSKEWHWMKGGILVSLLSVVTYWLFEFLKFKKYPFGVTAGFGYVSAQLGKVTGELSQNPVLAKYSSNILGFAILIGLILGGFAAAKLSRSFTVEHIPAVWKKYHGENKLKRFSIVLLGGFLLGFGAAFAGGCTTGNILQGWAHLSMGSLVAGISFFAAGMLIAKILYPKPGENHHVD